MICFSLKGSVGCLISLFSYLSLSSRIEPLGTPLCPHLVWLRQCWRLSSYCILSVTSPLSVAWVTCSMANSNIAKAALFTQDIVELNTFRKTCCVVSSPFMIPEKVEPWHIKSWLKEKLLSTCSKVFLLLDWFAEQLLDGVFCRWLLQSACLWGTHSQEGWHNHDNGKDGIERQGVGWSGGKGAEIAPKVLMCLPPPVFHLFPLSFFFCLHCSRLPVFSVPADH